MSADILCGQLALHNHLCGDTRVICTHLPEGVIAAHAAVANQRIHHCIVKAMSHVQATSDVGWRDHDAIGRTIARWLEVAFFFPGLIPLTFDTVRLVGFFHW